MHNPPLRLDTYSDVLGGIIVVAFIIFGWGGLLYFAVVAIVAALMH